MSASFSLRVRSSLPVLLLAVAAAFPAHAGRPVLVRSEGGQLVLTDRPDPSRPALLPRGVTRTYRVASRPTTSGPVPYDALIRQVAAREGLDPALVRAVVRAESSYDPTAVSSAGAMGLMQLMPATAKRFGVRDPFDPFQNLQGGARYLHWLLDRFQGDLALALAAYHAGEGSVSRYGGVPPFPETRRYLRRVLAELDGGPASHRRGSTPGLKVRQEGGILVVSN